MPRTDTSTTGWPIAAVERDTGIGRDTLRIWERRYGFPKPDRSSKGERIYPERQIRRLQLIRRLMDQGWRPGRIVGMDESALVDLANDQEPDAETEARRLGPLLEAVHRHESDALSSLLADAYVRLGLRRLILEVVAPAARVVGERCAAGQIEIFEEHLFTEKNLVELRARIPEDTRVWIGGGGAQRLKRLPPPRHIQENPGRTLSQVFLPQPPMLCTKPSEAA